MFDIIRNSIKYEISMMLNLGIVSVLQTSYNQDTAITTVYASQKKAIEKKIERTFQDFVD